MDYDKLSDTDKIAVMDLALKIRKDVSSGERFESNSTEERIRKIAEIARALAKHL